MIFSLTAHRVLDLLFPERCVLCGGYLSFRSRRGPFPVCGDCAGSFVPEAGPRCAVCSMPLISEDRLCMRCRGRERRFADNHSLFLYSRPRVARALAAYKGEGATGLAIFFGDFLADHLRGMDPGLVLVPVPCRRESLTRRGFDQVLLLCRALRRRHGFRYRRLLVRRGGGREQKTLNRTDRETNLRGAIQPKKSIRGGVPKRVVLLDDVFTTGATADACAGVLTAMGVERVSVLTIAID